jgi:hypothetical protein
VISSIRLRQVGHALNCLFYNSGSTSFENLKNDAPMNFGQLK